MDRAKLQLDAAGLLSSIDQRFVVERAGVVENLPWRGRGCDRGIGSAVLLSTVLMLQCRRPLSMVDTLHLQVMPSVPTA